MRDLDITGKEIMGLGTLKGSAIVCQKHAEHRINILDIELKNN